MKFKITLTDRFHKHFKPLNVNEKKQVLKKIEILLENPMHPSLRTTPIKGTMNLFECSANMDIRIIWHYDSDTIIILLDVGHHDILKNF